MECIEGQHRLEAHRHGTNNMSVSKRKNVVKELELLLDVAKDMVDGIPTTLACTQRGVKPNKFMTFLRRDLFNEGEPYISDKDIVNDYFSFEDRLICALLGKGHSVLPDFKEAYKKALLTLKEREAKVISMRFEDNATLDEVAEALGITKERVRQIELLSLRKLRAPSRIWMFSEGLQAKELHSEKAQYLHFKKEKEEQLALLRKKCAILHRQVDKLKVINESLDNDTEYKEAYKEYDVQTTPIEELDLSVRAYNCLRRAGIPTVGELMGLSRKELMSVRNFGKVSFNEIASYMAEHYNFSFKEE